MDICPPTTTVALPVAGSLATEHKCHLLTIRRISAKLCISKRHFGCSPASISNSIKLVESCLATLAYGSKVNMLAIWCPVNYTVGITMFRQAHRHASGCGHYISIHITIIVATES